jgi:hypothetical protein
MTSERSPLIPPRRRRRAVVVVCCVLAALVVTLLVVRIPEPAKSEAYIFDSPVPATAPVADDASVEVGVQFSSSGDGWVTGIRFYKGEGNTGTHLGTLWDVSGKALARVTFVGETASGWQEARFSTPVPLHHGRTVVASYLAPRGHYSADAHALAAPHTRGLLSVPAGGGVYTYGSGAFPSLAFGDSNYYVDVMFRPAGPGESVPGQQDAAPDVRGTSDPAPTAAAPVPLSVPSADSGGALSLPRIPWEGGPAYWKQFSKADAAGWADPAFFPIVSWFGNFSTNEEVAYDKSLGINTYAGMWDGTPYQLFADNNVFWIGGKLNSGFTNDSVNWVGQFLDDEVDGRFTPADGQKHLQALVDALPNDGRFRYANFTQMVIARDLPEAAARRYVNGYTDVVSVDMYWYTIPFCDQSPYRDVYLTPVAQATCRTASSYGATLKSLRAQDASDGRLQPMWQWVENLNGGPADAAPKAYITPGQLKGAVMNSIINEARGIAYFNQSLSGPCQSANVVRQSQLTKNFCGADQIAAVKQVNDQVHALARVINTQSYKYSFGRGLDTMLKTYAGSAYIFSMIDGSAGPGTRRFTLPPGVKAANVEVLGEGRTLSVDTHGRFTDSFAKEFSYHIYRVPLAAAGGSQ